MKPYTSFDTQEEAEQFVVEMLVQGFRSCRIVHTSFYVVVFDGY